MTQYQPYQGTQVPIERSQAGIRKLFDANRVFAHQYTEDRESQKFQIRWSRKLVIEKDGVKKEVLQPCKMQISYKGRKPEQVWRAAFYHLKAKFEAVQFGLVSYEEEFLPYFETVLPNGNMGTIAEAMIPALQIGRKPDMLALPEGRSQDMS